MRTRESAQAMSESTDKDDCRTTQGQVLTPEQAAEQTRREEELIQQVLDSFTSAPDARTKELMQSLVTQLRAFIRKVRLAEAEWDTAIEFLTAVGHITDDRRQEFVLLSDVLGASMQTVAVNNPAVGEAIPGARIEVREADEDGLYDVQYDDNRMVGRAFSCIPGPTGSSRSGV